MSFIWTIVKAYIAICGYNTVVDYYITKKAFKDISKDYDFLLKTKYQVIDSLSFNVLLDTISVYSKLRYYDEFKSMLTEEFLNEKIIISKDNNDNLDIDFENKTIVKKEEVIKEEINENTLENNTYNKNKPKILVKKKEDRRK